MTRVAAYVSPVEPDAKAAWLARNRSAGWQLQPGAADIESGYIVWRQEVA